MCWSTPASAIQVNAVLGAAELFSPAGTVGDGEQEPVLEGEDVGVAGGGLNP